MKSISSKPGAADVEQQLARILASTGFARAERMGRFLQYIVAQSLAGKADELKETLIGVEVFGRPPEFDPRVDSIVRMEASRLRSRLQEYYAAEGKTDPVVIQIPKGGYSPAISLRPPPGAMPRDRSGWIAAAAVIASVVILGFWIRRPSQPEAIAGHFVVNPPDGTRIALRMPNKALASVAPDGKNLTLVAEDASGQRALWLRPLASASFRRLDQTEGASLAFWSPDSRNIGFFAEGKLKWIPMSGGPSQTICEIAPGDGEGATWNAEGIVVFAPPRPKPAALPEGALSWVPVAGGSPQPATSLDTAAGELSHSWPQFLPDGRHFLYLSRNKDPEKSGVYVQELGAKTRKLLLKSRTHATYAPGPDGEAYLLFPRDQALLARPFDLSRLELSREPVAVASGVSYNTLYGTSTFSVSSVGVLAYRTGRISAGTSPPRLLSWYTRKGDRQSAIGEPGLFSQLALSPDETRVAVDRNMRPNDTGYWDIWIVDLTSGVFSRLTNGPAFASPVWSPDSRKIAAVAREGQKYNIVEIPLDSGSPSILTPVPERPAALESWAPRPPAIFFSSPTASFRLPLSGNRTPQPILNADIFGGRSRLSPDGHWIAYQSAESGKYEVYIRSFPALDRKHQVSNGGGVQPIWSKDGREFYYLTLNARLMAAEVKSSAAALDIGAPKPLFQSPVAGNPLLSQYAVSGDGQRFLMMEDSRDGAGSAGTEPFHLEMNWFAALKAGGPAKGSR